MYNRLGAMNPGGMIYALKSDVVAIDAAKGIIAGNVRLRPDKAKADCPAHEQWRLSAK